MGQSVSNIERNKAKPIRPNKIFGLIYFQRDYKEVVFSSKQMAEKHYNKEKTKYIDKLYVEQFVPEYEALKKQVTEKTDESLIKVKWQGLDQESLKIWTKPVNAWKDKFKQIEEEKYDQGFAAYFQKNGGEFKESQGMGDLNATYNDAQIMYDFLALELCKDVEDITVMSAKRDYFRVFKKPEYNGDFHTLIFDFNKNDEAKAFEMKMIKQGTIQIKQPAQDLSWEKFNENLRRIKYKSKHATRSWKKDQVKKGIKWFKDADGKLERWKEGFDSLPENEDLTEEQKKPFKCYGPEERFKNKDYWEMPNDPRAKRIFKMVHPLVYQTEKEPAFEKIQNNWVFQCLDAEFKKHYLQNRKPNYKAPSKENYIAYMKMIRDYHDNNKDQEILSIQAFACHGVIKKGCQSVLLNEFDANEHYYAMIDVEHKIRNDAKDLPRVYFMTLFACCRESFTSKSKELQKKEDKEGQAARGNVKTSQIAVMNFTFVFGCNPAEGVKADTEFIKNIRDHMRGLFDPEDDSLMFPECLGIIDSTKGSENFESTSCNIGRSLRLQRWNNRVGIKQLIVIKREPEVGENRNIVLPGTGEIQDMVVRFFGFVDEAEPDYSDIEDEERQGFQKEEKFVMKTDEEVSAMNDEEQFEYEQRKRESELSNRTKRVLRFFTKHLLFDKKKELLIMTEKEAYEHDFYLQQSRPYKQYNKKLQKMLSIYAKRLFGNQQSNQQQLLQVFLNESDLEDVFDFIVNRNTEMGLQIIHPRSWYRGDDKLLVNEEQDEIVKIYIRKLREKLKSVNQVPFNNLNSFFHNILGVVNFSCRRKKFKQGTGQFDYILDLPIKEDRTLKFRFDYLAKKPLRKLDVAKFSIGFAVNDPHRGKKEVKKNELGYEIKETKEEAEGILAENETVLIMELEDVNDSYSHKEIKRRTKLDASKNEKPEKYLFAYTFKPTQTEKEIQDIKNKAKGKKVKIEGLNENDEVVALKKLHHDLIRKEVIFQIVLYKQHSATIGVLNYSQWNRLKINDEQGQDEKISIKVKNYQIVKEHVAREPGDEEESETKPPFRAWPTELEFSFHDQLQKEEEMLFFLECRSRLLTNSIKHKINSAILKRCTKNFDENKAFEEWKKHLQENDNELKKKLEELRANFKILIPAENLNIVVVKDKDEQNPGLMFYVFSNRMMINGKNSELEVEVWKWHQNREFEADDKITRIEHDLDVDIRRITDDHISIFEEEYEREKYMWMPQLEPEKKLTFQQNLDKKKGEYDEKNKRKEIEERIKKKETGKKFNRGESDFEVKYDKRVLSKKEKTEEKLEDGRVVSKKMLKDGRVENDTELRKQEDTLEYDRFEFKKQSTKKYGKKVSRVFLRYLIRDNDEKSATKNKFYVDRIMNLEHDKEDQEFWLKQPTCFKQSTDCPTHLLFQASTRSMYIFDLKLENAILRLYTEKDKKEGNAFCWQEVPFTHKLDMIGTNHVSMLVGKREAKWQKTTQTHIEGIKGTLTQLIDLPSIVFFPDDLPDVEEHIDDYKKAALYEKFEKEMKIKLDKIKKIQEENKEMTFEEAKNLYEEQKKMEDEVELKEKVKKRDENRKQIYEIERARRVREEEPYISYEEFYKEDEDINDQQEYFNEEKQYLERTKKVLKFLFANDKKSISIVNFSEENQTGLEFLLVQLKFKTDYDSLENLFITYDKKSRRIIIHYFEKLYDYYKHLTRSTYNYLELSEDFLLMLLQTQEMVPHEQPKVIKRLRAIKAPPVRPISLRVDCKEIKDIEEKYKVTEPAPEKPIKPVVSAEQEGENEEMIAEREKRVQELKNHHRDLSEYMENLKKAALQTDELANDSEGE